MRCLLHAGATTSFTNCAVKPVLLVAVLITISAHGVAQRKGSNRKSLRARFSAATEDDQKLKQLVDQVLVGDKSSIRALKLLVDGQGKKQLPKYLKSFVTEIPRSPKIDRESVVANDPKLVQRRAAIVRLGASSYRLRDALELKVKPQDASPNKREFDKDVRVGESNTKDKGNPDAFDDFLSRQEDTAIRDWMRRQGFGQLNATEQSVLDTLNQIRAANKLPPFVSDDRLHVAARDHTRDMAKRGFFSHVSPVKNKRTYKVRAERFGSVCYAENIARGDTVPLMIRSWMNSGPHRRNILDPRYTSIGVGAVGKKITTMFGVAKVAKKDE